MRNLEAVVVAVAMKVVRTRSLVEGSNKQNDRTKRLDPHSGEEGGNPEVEGVSEEGTICDSVAY